MPQVIVGSTKPQLDYLINLLRRPEVVEAIGLDEVFEIIGNKLNPETAPLIFDVLTDYDAVHLFGVPRISDFLIDCLQNKTGALVEDLDDLRDLFINFKFIGNLGADFYIRLFSGDGMELLTDLLTNSQSFCAAFFSTDMFRELGADNIRRLLLDKNS